MASFALPWRPFPSLGSLVSISLLQKSFDKATARLWQMNAHTERLRAPKQLLRDIRLHHQGALALFFGHKDMQQLITRWHGGKKSSADAE